MDGLSRRRIVEACPIADQPITAHCDAKTAPRRRVSVEGLENQRVQHGSESDQRTRRHGIAKRKRPVRRQIGDEPIRQRTKEIVGIFFVRSEEHTSELQSLMRISYAVFCLKKK